MKAQYMLGGCALSIGLCCIASAQPSESVPCFLASGEQENTGAEVMTIAVGTVVQRGAAWLRVRVGRAQLGEESYVVFRSVEDGSYLRHDARTLAQWGGWSAFFNGDAVDVELHIAPWENGIFLEVNEVLVGSREAAGNGAAPGVIDEHGVVTGGCNEDNRVGSTARRICRFINGNNSAPDAKCSGWIIANGGLLTAGHCESIIDPNYPIAEFDVPGSDCDGTVNFGDADNQYAVNLNSISFESSGVGADWTILGVFPNPNTGLMPAYGENAFARLAQDLELLDPDSLRITGCGKDDDPEGCTGSLNSDNRTIQTAVGDFVKEDSDANATWLEYDLYGRDGLSGGAVFDLDSNLGIGIHTASSEGGSCPSWGTSFNHEPLESAINTFPGTNTVYVDGNHPIILQGGEIFSPWLTLEFGVAAVPSGGTLSVVGGDYTYALSGGVITKALLITAPVGPVIITN